MGIQPLRNNRDNVRHSTNHHRFSGVRSYHTLSSDEQSVNTAVLFLTASQVNRLSKWRNEHCDGYVTLEC